MDHDYIAEEDNEDRQNFFVLHGNKLAQQFVKNLFSYFRERHPELSALQETATALHISPNTVRKYKDGPQETTEKLTRKRKKCLTDDLTETARIDVKHEIYDMYAERSPVDLNSLLFRLRTKEKYFGSKTSLFKLLKRIGFSYRKDDNRRALMEKPHIASLRRQFLKRYMENESLGPAKKPCMFLDETWIFSNGSFRRSWQDDDERSVRKDSGEGNRSHKRYYYQNRTTGVSQWRYPEPDVTRCDDAMDICTTPPPQDFRDVAPPLDDNPVSPVMFGPQLPPAPPLPPSPPKIRSPTPPPPPMISMAAPEANIPDVPLPPSPIQEKMVPQPPLPPLENGQPLPPGVDLLPDAYNKPKEPDVKPSDTLITALDSFYSEIAEVSETANSSSPIPPSQALEMPSEGSQELLNQPNSEIFKKKKKKVKLVHGLTMKKKGVSQLVEKWKNVQKSYGD